MVIVKKRAGLTVDDIFLLHVPWFNDSLIERNVLGTRAEA